MIFVDSKGCCDELNPEFAERTSFSDKRVVTKYLTVKSEHFLNIISYAIHYFLEVAVTTPY